MNQLFYKYALIQAEERRRRRLLRFALVSGLVSVFFAGVVVGRLV